jgi:hypothetical protein
MVNATTNVTNTQTRKGRAIAYNPLDKKTPIRARWQAPAIQSVGHAFPYRCPAHAGLDRVPLGPSPWLHQLLGQSPAFVRRLHRYYERV